MRKASLIYSNMGAWRVFFACVIAGIFSFSGLNVLAQTTYTYPTAGSGNHTVGAGVYYVKVEVWGGGGGGGYRGNSGSTSAGGGGGGAYSSSILAVTPNTSYAYNVGEGGSGATGTNAGGDSWFINATTVMAKGGGGVADDTATGAAGGLATAGYGQIKFNGGYGYNAPNAVATRGGGGGSSAGTGAAGNATAAGSSGTPGGTAVSGGGAGGAGRNVNSSGVGNPGSAPGGGGGGAYRTGSGTYSGGTGGAGRVVITEYTTPPALQFNSPGTWTAPAGVTKVLVQAWGGGGRGGQRSNNGRGGGGGGGAFSSGTVTVVPGDTYYINVGGGSTSTGAGGDSWFHFENNAPNSDSYVLAKGGSSAPNNSNDGAIGGQGSAGYGNVSKYNGGDGANSSGNNTGGGGSSAGPGGGGANGTAPTGGNGTPVGGGNGANGHNNQNTPGNPGVAPGGGGSGARRNAGTLLGGAGANGQVIIKILDADVGIVTSSSSMTPDVGSNVTLTFTVTNYGPEPANGIVMNETVPSGLSYMSNSTPSQGSVDLVNSLWNVGTLAPMTSATLSVTFEVQASGSYANQATVTATESDLNISNNTSSLTLYPVTPTANLRITKEADNYHPLVEDQVTFTLTAYNSGPQNATNVLVTDQLPSGLTYQSHSGGTYNNINGQWTIGNLANGASAALTITATVAATGSYTNQATINGDQFDPATNNNTSSISVFPTYAPVTIELDCEDTTYDLTSFTDDYTIANIPPGANLTWHTASEANSGNIYSGNLSSVPVGTYYLAFYDPVLGCYSLTTQVTIENNCADLGIEKTVNNPTPTVGQVVTFILTITNHGPSDATNIVIEDLIPNGYTNISGISPVGDWDTDTRTITWTVPSMPEGASMVFTYQAKVLAKGDGISHSNTASITGLDQTDHNPANDSDTLALDPRPSMLITNPMIRQRVTGGGD